MTSASHVRAVATAVAPHGGHLPTSDYMQVCANTTPHPVNPDGPSRAVETVQ